MDKLKNVINSEDSNFTLEEVAELIEFLNKEKNLDLEETKKIINEVKPTKPEMDANHLGHPHEPSTN